jgi:methanol metabolism-related c-type cytochrome
VRICFVAVALAAMVACSPFALADGSGDPAAVKNDDGKYVDKDGNPTFKVAPDGTVDWYTYSGFRRYHSECHVCHGPDAEGSSYAPALKESLKTMSYTDFMNVVVNGRQNVNTAQENVMPAFGTNLNVMCYLDDIFVYIRARSDDAIGRGRPAKHDDKSAAAGKAETSCMGQH